MGSACSTKKAIEVSTTNTYASPTKQELKKEIVEATTQFLTSDFDIGTSQQEAERQAKDAVFQIILDKHLSNIPSHVPESQIPEVRSQWQSLVSSVVAEVTQEHYQNKRMVETEQNGEERVDHNTSGISGAIVQQDDLSIAETLPERICESSPKTSTAAISQQFDSSDEKNHHHVHSNIMDTSVTHDITDASLIEQDTSIPRLENFEGELAPIDQSMDEGTQSVLETNDRPFDVAETSAATICAMDNSLPTLDTVECRMGPDSTENSISFSCLHSSGVASSPQPDNDNKCQENVEPNEIGLPSVQKIMVGQRKTSTEVMLHDLDGQREGETVPGTAVAPAVDVAPPPSEGFARKKPVRGLPPLKGAKEPLRELPPLKVKGPAPLSGI